MWRNHPGSELFARNWMWLATCGREELIQIRGRLSPFSMPQIVERNCSRRRFSCFQQERARLRPSVGHVVVVGFWPHFVLDHVGTPSILLTALVSSPSNSVKLFDQFVKNKNRSCASRVLAVLASCKIRKVTLRLEENFLTHHSVLCNLFLTISLCARSPSLLESSFCVGQNGVRTRFSKPLLVRVSGLQVLLTCNPKSFPRWSGMDRKRKH